MWLEKHVTPKPRLPDRVFHGLSGGGGGLAADRPQNPKETMMQNTEETTPPEVRAMRIKNAQGECLIQIIKEAVPASDGTPTLTISAEAMGVCTALTLPFAVADDLANLIHRFTRETKLIRIERNGS